MVPSRAPRPNLVRLRGPLVDVDDATLALAMVAGERHAPAEVWDRFAGLVSRLARHALGPRGEVDDLVQEVFLAYFDRPAALRDPGALRSFLVGVTLRQIKRELFRRRARAWLRLAPPEELAETHGAPADPAQRQMLRRLDRLLSETGDEARLAFVLRAVEGYTLPEVAIFLGKSPATIKRRLAEVAERMDRVLADDPALARYVESRAGERS